MFTQMNGGDDYKSVSVKLAKDIVDKIHKRVYSDRLPTMQALAAEYGVNFKTANRAASLLVKVNVL